MIQEHLVAHLAAQSQQTAGELVALYNDAPHVKASSSSKAGDDPLADAFETFYHGVQQIDEWFRDYPNDGAQDMTIALPGREAFEEGTLLFQAGGRARVLITREDRGACEILWRGSTGTLPRPEQPL